MRAYLLIVLLLAMPTHAHAARPLALHAATNRSEYARGDTLIVDAYLFNDGATSERAAIGIQVPIWLELIRVSPVVTTTPLLAPGRALHMQWAYHVANDAPKGLGNVVVVAFDDAGLPQQAAAVVIRIGPITAQAPPRPPPSRIRLPMMRW